MKKLIFLMVMFITILSYSQTTINAPDVAVKQDSILAVTSQREAVHIPLTTLSGWIINDVGNSFLPIDGSLPMTGSIDLNGNSLIDINGVSFNNGENITWNSDFKTINIPTGTGSTLQVGQEFYFLIYNDTGAQLDNGQIVKPLAGFLVGSEVLPTVELAKSDTHITSNGTLFMVTSDIADGEVGMATILGRVSYDTSLFSAGSDLYLSPTISGGITDVKPSFPNYTLTIGGVINSHATEGIIGFNATRSVEDTMLNFFNGTFRETLEFLVASDGVTITGSLAPSNGHPDMTMIFSDGFTILDTSPPATITLIAGTDINPQTNYIYVPISTKVLTVSTSGFPTTEHIKVAYTLVSSVSTVQTDKALINHNLNDHLQSTTTNQGHLSHVTQRLRLEGAHWISGCEGSSVVNNTPTPDSVSLVATGGIVTQLHNQNFDAFDTAVSGHAHVVNHSTTAYKEIADLHDLVVDGEVVTNTSFSIVKWGVINSAGEPSKLMINLPSNSYAFASPDDAVNDALNYSNYDIPTQFKTVAFLIDRTTYTYKNNDWVVYDIEDLRGKVPNATAGGGGAGGGVTTFLGLTDTPSSNVSQSLFFTRVNLLETALEYVDTETLFITKDTDQLTNITGDKTLDGDWKYNKTTSEIETIGDLSVINKRYLDENIINRRGIAFIFDDGWETDYDVVMPIFESKDITCGFAPVTQLLDIANRLTSNQLLDLDKRGFEILAHSKNHIDFNVVDVGFKRAESEMKQSYDHLRFLGLQVDGWATPFSIMHINYLPQLPNYFNYAFTTSHGNIPNQEYDDPYLLSRFGLESNTLQDAKDQADIAITENKAIIFYAHDVQSGTQEETDLIALLDYCIAEGYPILNPRDLMNKTFEMKKVEKYKSETVLFNDITGWTSLESTLVLASDILTVTPDNATSQMVVQKSVPISSLNRDFINNEQVSFSIDAELIAGISPVNSAIGIKFLDSGSGTLYLKEENGFNFDDSGLRYYIKAQIPENTNSILIFLRITVTDATTEIDLKEPLITTGDNILSTLSPLNPSSFLRKDQSDTMTGDLTVTENVYAQGSRYYGDSKALFRYDDTFLRINGDGHFSSGVYFGASAVRADGTLQIGGGAQILLNTTGINSIGYRIKALQTAPSSASDTGTLGEIRYDANYIYLCTATNTWKRSALTTW